MSRHTLGVLVILIATGCSSGVDPALQELYDHAAHVTVVAPTTGTCVAGTGLPLRVRLLVDGWSGEPEIVDTPLAFSTAFEPGNHSAYLQYGAYGCADPFHYLEAPLRRDEHRLIVVTNEGAVGTEAVHVSQLPYPPPRDGRTIYVFNFAATDAGIGLDEDGDGAADSPVPVRPLEHAELVRATDQEVGVVAEVGGDTLSATASAVFDAIGPTPWSMDARACLVHTSFGAARLDCVLLTHGGIGHWTSDPTARF